MPKRSRNIDRIFEDGHAIAAAVAKGVDDALRRHVRAGVPAAESKGDRPVLVSPRRLAARLRANGGRKTIA